MKGENTSHESRARFEYLYLHEQASARRVIRNVLFDPDAREDALAQTFTRLWRKMEAGPVKNPERLLPLIAHGCAVDAYRALKRRRNVEIPVGLAYDLAGIEEQMHVRGRPLPERLWTFPTELDLAVRDLEEDGRHAFILTDLRGLDQFEAARVLGVSQQSVSRWAGAARTRIREELSR